MGRLTESAAPRTRHWPEGETRLIGKAPDQIPVTRTNREYAYDLCDAYNANRTRDDIEWFVHDGQLHLGTPLKASLETSRRVALQKENERNLWKRKRAEAERMAANDQRADRAA